MCSWRNCWDDKCRPMIPVSSCLLVVPLCSVVTNGNMTLPSPFLESPSVAMRNGAVQMFCVVSEAKPNESSLVVVASTFVEKTVRPAVEH